MVTIAYARLSTRSRRAMVRTTTKYGQPYHYRPRITLIQRLQKELGMSYEQVLDQIEKERRYLIATNT
ncbi:MAG: hypothetical protein AAF572_11680 [Cyanobacteria bacterium P01_B01_bin.77]